MPESTAALSLLQQRFGSADFNKWQVSRWKFYDYVELAAAGSNQISFFNNPLGSLDPVSGLAKTYEQTNLQKPASFGQVYYIINTVSFDCRLLAKSRQRVANVNGDANFCANSGNFMRDWYANFVNLGVAQFKVLAKDYFTLVQPFISAPAGFGLFDVRYPKMYEASSHRGNIAPLADASSNNVHQLAPQQMIEPESTFSLTIDYTLANYPALTNEYWATTAGATATPNVEVGVIFDGYIARPVQ